MSFLNQVLSNKGLQTLLSEEKDIWETIEESATIISLQGMGEDRHLSLLTNGWEGLLHFTGNRLLSEIAEQSCVDYVSFLVDSFKVPGVNIDDDARLLNGSLVYLFPTFVVL